MCVWGGGGGNRYEVIENLYYFSYGMIFCYRQMLSGVLFSYGQMLYIRTSGEIKNFLYVKGAAAPWIFFFVLIYLSMHDAFHLDKETIGICAAPENTLVSIEVGKQLHWNRMWEVKLVLITQNSISLVLSVMMSILHLPIMDSAFAHRRIS